MNKNQLSKESLDYIYKNKNGLKKDLISKFNIDTYDSLIYSNLIIPCVRVNGDLSWKISKDGYDLYINLNPNLQYKTFTTKFIDFVNDFLYFKNEKKEFIKNKEIKDKYFQNQNSK